LRKVKKIPPQIKSALSIDHVSCSKLYDALFISDITLDARRTNLQ